MECGPRRKRHGEGFSGKVLMTREVLENMFRTGAVIANGEGHERLLRKQHEQNEAVMEESKRYYQGLADRRLELLSKAGDDRKSILSVIFDRIEVKNIHVSAASLDAIADMDVDQLSNLFTDMQGNPFLVDLSITPAPEEPSLAAGPR